MLPEIYKSYFDDLAVLNLDHFFSSSYDSIYMQSLAKAQIKRRSFIANGLLGEMTYLAKNEALAYSPQMVLPGCRSLLIVLVSYSNKMREHSISTNDVIAFLNASASKDWGKVSRAAQGPDYHKIVRKKLKLVLSWIEDQFPDETHRILVDANPLDERFFAWAAGLGFIGKNSMLIHPELGSDFYIGMLLSSAVFPENLLGENKRRQALSCLCPEKCTACQEACPSGALSIEDGIDVQRCLSYLTLESNQELPDTIPLRRQIAGCDYCQESCAWQPSYTKKTILNAVLSLSEVLKIRSKQDMIQKFAGTMLMRCGRSGIIRNAMKIVKEENIVALLPEIQALSEDPDEFICKEALKTIRHLLAIMGTSAYNQE